ncbi:coniferyl aldehyde dehydrogenase [Noviherbaspirillum sp. 1P10PC]|uniref:coniferyl aldehyde dehydrogenase n=1 Tax=Noviherbaspirillum sp. 1P10PC TaxID=3132292 RepID=UPI0039A34252
MTQTVPHDAALSAMFETLRAQSRKDGMVSWQTRADRLSRLRSLVRDHRGTIGAAISADFGQRSRHETELLEINHVLDGIHHSLQHGQRWMRTQDRKRSYKYWPGRASILPQPLGAVGVIVPWNYPLDLSLGPANSALTAGNRVMIKLSELTPHFGALLAELAARYFAQDELCIVNGGVDTGRAFCALPFDHLLFTGSTAVGHQVMHAASDNLTPVTLELGGKSPAIIGPRAGPAGDFDKAVMRLVMGKTLNAGQTCIAPDYAFVPRGQAARFIASARRAVAAFYPSLATTSDYTSIISDRHFQRLQAMVDDAVGRGAQASPLSDAASDPARRRFAPLVLSNVAPGSRVLEEEIFGPVLPLLEYDDLEQVIDYINQRPRPLALYLFESDRKKVERVLTATVSGGVTVNDVFFHVGPDTLPFGGVGASGMGAYHGETGFRTFSHDKPVFRQPAFSLLSWVYPPYGRRAERLLRMPD